jgi:membrane-associated phospholipid phosphatase
VRGRTAQRIGILTLCVALGPGGGAARAQDSGSEGLEFRPSLDVPLTLAGAAGAFAPRLLTDASKTWTCRWCDRDDQGRSTLNGLDAAARRHWRWSNRERAYNWSNAALGLSLVAPTTAFVAGRGGFGDGFGGEMLIVLEASAVNLALTQGTKYLFRRARPWAQAEDPPRGHRVGSRESVVSFVSGHSSLAFAIAVSTGSLASLRGDEGKEWVWATGLTCAAATAYLRVAADRHYLTDVLAGAALGAAVGWVVPRLIDRRPDEGGEAVVARPTPPVAAFGFVIGGSAGPRPSGVLVTGGLQSGGPFVSATWSF